MKRFPLFLLAVACAASIQGVLLAGGIVVNATPSLPEGLYQKKARPVRKGCFVLFRLPASELSTRPYARENLIKQVVAAGGDRVCVEASGVRINGQMLANSAQLESDRDGRPLPHFTLPDYTLKEGELLTMSTYNPRSFDSRYFGLVRRDSIIAVVVPLLVW